LLTKHALCIYSTDAPDAPFAWADLQAEVDAAPRRKVAVDHDGGVKVETYVVMYGPDRAPNIAHAACLLDDGRRTWANMTDMDTLGAMIKGEFCGRGGAIDGAGNLRLN
jgi:acetyl-CoA C-acetyltransferase